MPARLSWERNGRRTMVPLGPTILVGRDPRCQVRVETAADLHCRIVRHGEGYVVEHVEGIATTVNGTSIAARPHVLSDGDEIVCAGVALRFDARGSSPLPRTDAETQRLPIDRAVALRTQPARTIHGDQLARIAGLEREVAELRAELARVSERIARFDDDSRRT